jgi:hypothetical protein
MVVVGGFVEAEELLIDRDVVYSELFLARQVDCVE